MARESIPPPAPLSPEEIARVRNNVAFLHENVPGETDFTAVLEAVERAEPGKAPELPEELWPVLEKLRIQTKERLQGILKAAPKTELDQIVARHTRPIALLTARDKNGHLLSAPFGPDDFGCGF